VSEDSLYGALHAGARGGPVRSVPRGVQGLGRDEAARGTRRTAVALAAALAFCAPAGATPLLFLSTQLTPVPEATVMRQVILKDFGHAVDFEPVDRSVLLSRARDLGADAGPPAVLGSLEVDLQELHQAGALASVDDIMDQISPRPFLPRFDGRNLFETNRAYFVPWMQATYLMAASTQALRYLPRGASLDRLTYDELRDWAVAMYRATGKGMLGFPMGPRGLMHRFLEGYLYPSFTGSMWNSFDGPEAAALWQYLGGLCRYVAPSSLVRNRMDEALLDGEVWVAWDHSARLLDAFRKQPGEFVAFPAPVGPRGRGFIVVLAGLGVTRGPASAAAADLIEYLTRPTTQAATMESAGFLPVVQMGTGMGLSVGSRALVQAALEQLVSGEGIISSVPPLSGDAARRFDLVYLNAFSRIVLQNQAAGPVLTEQKALLRDLLSTALPVREQTRGH